MHDRRFCGKTAYIVECLVAVARSPIEIRYLCPKNPVSNSQGRSANTQNTQKKINRETMSETVCTGTIALECKPKPTPPPPPPPPKPKPSQPTFYYLLAVLGLLVLSGANAATYYGSSSTACHTNDCHEPKVHHHKRILKHGSKGEDVKRLQKVLLARGFCPRNFVPDGVFGPTTQKAVKQFQRQANLRADGVVGRETWDRIFASS